MNEWIKPVVRNRETADPERTAPIRIAVDTHHPDPVSHRRHDDREILRVRSDFFGRFYLGSIFQAAGHEYGRLFPVDPVGKLLAQGSVVFPLPANGKFIQKGGNTGRPAPALAVRALR